MVRLFTAWGLGLCLVSGLAFAGHSLDEAIFMVNHDWVQTDQVVVKLYDSVKWTGDNLADSWTQKHVLPYTVEKLFKRPVRDYQMERDGFWNHSQMKMPHLENYLKFRLTTPSTASQRVTLLKELFSNAEVEFAYFEPISKNAVFKVIRKSTLDAVWDDEKTPDFENLQFHLNAAPEGVDARYGWTIEGGTGQGVRVVDVEFGWHDQHEDFSERFWFNPYSLNWHSHGTAVWGEVAAKRDGVGVTGIAYDVEFGTAGSHDGAATYDEAAAQLRPGDIMIIEQHQPGPDEGKYTAMEYWQANFDAMKTATLKGIVIIAAAGNGDSNFDSPNYKGAFDLNERDSGCILVGAGGPPQSADYLKRLYFSNYGSRVDVFGYGWSVVTTGYGALFNPEGDLRDYTDAFNGTSSATPIVVGAVASLMGMARAKGWVLTPQQVRTALRNTGTPQQGNTAERIGNLPDIKQLHEYFGKFSN